MSGLTGFLRPFHRIPFGAEESVVQTEVVGTKDGVQTGIGRWIRGPDQKTVKVTKDGDSSTSSRAWYSRLQIYNPI